jgi:hypothetical protein
MSQIYFPGISDNKEASAGYTGGDEFAIIESSFAQRFPITNKEGKIMTRQIQYKLKDGEASRKLEIVKIVEF